MIRMPSILIVIMVTLAACASGTTERKPVAPAPETPKPGNLPSQTLPGGECALFLWTQGEPRRFIFFSRASTGVAEVMFSEGQQTLTLTRQGGTLFGQFMTDMDFVTPASESVNLRITPGELVENGQKISSGRIKILNAGGWETLIPVVGIRACQPDTE